MERLNVGSDKLKTMMSTIIKGKFTEIKELTIINPKYAIIYQRTKECERIQDVVDQYLVKYQSILEWAHDESYNHALNEI